MRPMEVEWIRLFCLLSLVFFSDAIVMDEKVKESSVLNRVSAIYSYNAHYKGYPKYWCHGYIQDCCNILALTPNSTGRVTLKDMGNKLIVTVSCLTKEDSGWYCCDIQRNFAQDDMDFTELVVTDNREALIDDIWSEKDLQETTKRSCWDYLVQKANHSRMFFLIMCSLITSLGIISIAVICAKGRSQRNRRGSLKLFSLVLTPKEMTHTEEI
ncbi:LOW QUALITY PROTEIN: transmembrane domain-containing protein TMIGD3-like [Rhynchocyon petersi]